MKRVCYEIKTSRADFLSEMKQPLKRRIGLRYSNEFYFVTPAGLLSISDIPVECGLIQIGRSPNGSPNTMQPGTDAFRYFAPQQEAYCQVAVPAPWRETPGPTWQFVAGMLRNQRKSWQERPPNPPAQQRFEFA
jgi:hypothetical protein